MDTASTGERARAHLRPRRRELACPTRPQRTARRPEPGRQTPGRSISGEGREGSDSSNDSARWPRHGISEQAAPPARRGGGE